MKHLNVILIATLALGVWLMYQIANQEATANMIAKDKFIQEMEKVAEELGAP